MGKKDKKKGKGVEKTIAKTEKKLAQKLRKSLAVAGEEVIENIVTRIEREDLKKPLVIKKLDIPPTRRVFCTLTPHPYKDEVIMFGGEFFNGRDTTVYNDLYIYKITNNEWIEVIAPGAPPPRTSHQTVASLSNKGEIWIFGGEYTTKNESQFHHYKDLWHFQLETRQWAKINAPGGPSPRSGHRMVLLKRQLIIFGGYHDNLQDFKYFNDVYSFSLDTRTWTKIEPLGTPPCPRSACQMFVTPEGKILVCGGYSKIKVKKDVDQGTLYTDTFLLSPEKGDESGLKWRWSSVKAGGVSCLGRSGVSGTYSGKRAFSFGGSTDHETEEDMTADYYNQLHALDLSRTVWSEVTLVGKKDPNKQRRRRRNKGKDTKIDEDTFEEMEVEDTVEETVTEDGIFTMKVNSASSSKSSQSNLQSDSSLQNISHPHPRINCTLAIKDSKLFLYGGTYDEGEIQYTLSDFYSIDINKFDEWNVIIPCDIKSQEWIDKSESDDSSSDEEDDNESDSDMEED